MKKTTVVLISIILIASFAGIVFYGIRYSRGIPVSIEKSERVHLEVPSIDKDIDLSKDLATDVWDGLAPKEVKLMYQLMILPWPKAVTQSIAVKAFHNTKDIYFYIRWKDDSENRIIERNKFSDACAILFPMEDKIQPPTIMMGFLGRANIWQWKASQDREYWLKAIRKTEAYSDFYYPFEEEELFVISKDTPKSSANDLMAIRVGTITPKEVQNVQGRGFWHGGIWQVVLRRSLKALDPEVDSVFNVGSKRLCAFAVWNGERGDRGGRKSISDWVELEIK